MRTSAPSAMKWTWLAALSIFWALAPAAIAQNSACLSCHGDKEAKDEADHSIYVSQSHFQASVHASLSCTDCHTPISGYPHPVHPSPVNCGICHADQASGVAESVHARASAQPCLACHGAPHEILAVADSKSPVYTLNLPHTCGICHGNPELAKRYGLPNVYSLYIDSIHGFALTRDGLLVAATCSSCHGAHKILSHKDPDSGTYRNKVPSACGSCHAGIKAKYSAGAHGEALLAGNPKVPVCTDCHTAHSILSVRTAAWQLKTTATCGNCHSSRLATYRDTFHGQVTALGFVITARCWNCHRAHEILPASDPQSSIAPANLQTTCGECHRAATRNFVTYDPHANPRDRKHYPGLFFTAHLMNLLMLAVFGFFGLHTILWFVRSMVERHKSALHGETDASSQS